MYKRQAKERRVNKDVLFSAIEAALISAYKKNYGKNANVRATIDREKGCLLYTSLRQRARG